MQLPFGLLSCYHQRMNKSTRVITKKKRPPQTGTLVGVRLQPDELAVLDRFIAENHPEMSRPEAIRECIRWWTAHKGVG